MSIPGAARAISLSFLATAVLIAAPTLAADDWPDRLEVLEPSDGWNIDFGADRCRLVRLFGEGDNRHLLMFEQAGPGTSFGLTLSGPRLRQFRQIITRLGFNPDSGFPRASHQWGEVEGFGRAAIFSRATINGASASAADQDGLRTLPQIDLEEAAQIERIVFGHGGNAVSFETGELSAPLQALNACAADFIRDWGLDPDKHERFFQVANWLNEQEVTRRIQRKFTRAALNRGEQAVFRMRVVVEIDGSVSECKLVESTVAQRINSNACDEMEDAVFDPALDSDRNPMRSFYTTNIIYRINESDAHG